MRTKLKSFLLLLAVMMLVPQGMKADIVTTTYDFNFSGSDNKTITWSSTTESSCTFFETVGGRTDYTRLATDGTNWNLTTKAGLYNNASGGRNFLVSKLYNGDVVTFNVSTNASYGIDVVLVSTNAKKSDNTFTMTAKGSLVVTIPRNSFITSIEVKHDDTAVWGYDPAVETYDLYYNTDGIASNNLKPAGFNLDYDDYEAQYLTNLSSGLALNDRIAISQVNNDNSVYTPWEIDHGFKSKWNWHNISITNLVEGDRVVITWMGNAKFSSKAEQMAYNGCAAFKDNGNDGDFTEGEDTEITLGMSLEAKSTNWDNNASANIFTSYPYVITEDGHLDIALSANSKIVKVVIYGDHQAEMVDKENSYGTSTSYFSTTGQLEAKHHIVPGGLHVYVGNDDDTQHAEVVSSDKGPVSFVYDEEHYKMARYGGVDVMGSLPATGTFYKFVPEVTGKMWLKFKAVSVKYRYYNNTSIPGNGVDSNGTPNEYTDNVSCPYYLMVAPGNNNATFSTVENAHYYGNGADGYFGSPNGNPGNGQSDGITVERGKTYYLYGWWQDGTNQGSLTNSACGVAELLEVTFLPNQMVEPLAKWVASGTTTDGDLATVKGYNTVCVKKKSSNIVSCEPYIEGGKLKIRNIVFNDANKGGGTILIKIGDPNIDADPVFAYTIAYNAAYNPQPVGKDGDGNNVTRSEGHTWNFSENPLKALKWNNKNAEADVVDFGTYFNNFATAEKDANGIPTNGVNQNSFLYEEYNKGDWTFNYRVKKNGSFMDPRFLNNWDMEGDNADMMWDTEGIIINAGSSQSCIFNEHGTTIDHGITNKVPNQIADPDRYIGFLEGGEFIIPQLKADDRVIVYMGSGAGSGAQAMEFHITNALDAVHNQIDPDDTYHIGGSQWNVPNGHNDPYYRSCYHFYAAADGDMKFKMSGGSMCKLYSIQIYRGERISTNAVQEAGGGYTILATKTKDEEGTVTTTTGTNTWNLHYRGKGETLADGTGKYSQENEVIAHSGNITNLTIDNPNNSTISYTNQGEIGMIRVRAKCMEYNHNYVTDFADRNMTLALHETQSYPYTWDFTDIDEFSSDAVEGEYDNYNELKSSETGYGYEPLGRELSMWDENGAMILYGPSDGYVNQNMIFENSKGISGNQLWANGAVLPETQGLWFYMDNNDATYNASMQITADGLHLMNNSTKGGRGWWNYKMVVPDVPAGAAVYLRMARDTRVPEFNENDVIGENNIADSYSYDLDKNTQQWNKNPYKMQKYQFGAMSAKAEIEDGTNCRFFKVDPSAEDDKTDYIVAIKNTGEESNLTFTLNGWVLKKMSVATDAKTVNKYGWNTESRERAIDPSLLPYLTGKDFRSYIVTSAKEEDNEAILARIDGGSGADGDNTSSNPNMKLIVPGATKVVNKEVVADNGSINAYIIRYVDNTVAEDERTIDMFGENSGFHLFVPDMHDAANTMPATNLLKAQVTNTNGAYTVPRNETKIENGETIITAKNYGFTYKFRKVNGAGSVVDEDGNVIENPETDAEEGVQAFYRIVSYGAKSGGHQAYLSIPVQTQTQTQEPEQEEGGAPSRALVASTSQSAEYYDILFQEWDNIESLKGDVNGDGRFNKLDVNTTADYLAGRPAGIFKGLADMNDDSRVDIIDLTLMIKKISGE